MLLVKTIIKESPIQGLGLFAAERISKGTVIWKYNPRFDISFTPEEVEKMRPMEKELINTYAYLSNDQHVYIYSMDNTRFTNHSSVNPNENVILLPGDTETSGVANRDIEVGEEILVNYRLFDEHDATSEEEYLKS